ncbi:MAG: L-glutamate gamma-semialdehyde dehydrogenase [Flavobacteriales bacterium]|jgi:1-pyrroline-5-carboxylate dehydrogenase|nr:L-glutamate gamma-semialdehyde dehydrogenase [Flavobacteriales bacterium]HOZ40702.1 L-glutamate gamma-semialdehyde dehydrogenase [Flavobacteriales bacterium]
MTDAIFHSPAAINETVQSYAPGTKEREQVLAEYDRMMKQKRELPMWIGGKAVETKDRRAARPPHQHKHILGYSHHGDKGHVKLAINAALKARKEWESMRWEDRAAIFLKAADLISGPYRATINAATMLAQSKNIYQAEIDAACEFADFLRFNVQFMQQIYRDQPVSAAGIWNRVEYRPLEGFVFALTPFNFTAIAGNLPSSAALMGNVVVWKPADSQVFSAQVIMDIFRLAGLPGGVINLIHVSGKDAGEVIFAHPEFAGLHFTGSTGVFQTLWKQIGNNISNYRSYPRIVGETGGKDFVIAHPSADPVQVATALSRGAFEFQGQKCSAASRAYIPSNIWPAVKKELLEDLKNFRMGDPRDMRNFINAVIDEKAFDKIAAYIDGLKKDKKNVTLIAGGKYDKSVGWFIEPTIAVTKDPKSTTMCEEIFGPVLTIHVYPENEWSKTLKLVDGTSAYALTGAVFSQDRGAIVEATDALRNAAGNFYINDKPTGAVVGQQPFGGARGSGTNDKAGSYLNLIRWVNARTIKETFVSPTDHRYPFMG